MRSLLQLAFLLLSGFASSAQQNYFAYVQTESKQPFYVKINDKLMSSSASGYIVIPKLSSGSYPLTVGFPKDIFPEQSLTLKIGAADAGFLLKNFGDKGWGLYNLQTMEMTMSGAAPVKSVQVDGNDAFSNALASATNTTAPVTVTKTVNIAPTTNTNPLQKSENIISAASLSVIQKIDGAAAPEGLSVVYKVTTGNSTDTVSIFIPAEIVPLKKKDGSKITDADAQVKETKFLDIELQNPNANKVDTEALVTGSAPVPEPPQADTAAESKTDKPVVAFNSDCRSNAGDDDFLRTRRRMAAETDEDAMANAAKRSFRSKCYSTEQVKNLSLLFLTDAGKYKFFDAAYPHTYDTQNFASLQSQLHEEYYVNRFRAMVRN